MSRLVKLLIALFIAGCCVVFAAALAGGLMDDRAFTPEAKGAAH
ncbi:hypothetical protein [Brevundimonas lenta]|uniref:Uncharacterized protein n=1 Tax=Brevundimonas lenta TaxID=424796 RepID=A0A7W6JEZ4_9CAUL|nr:hypothetical protein [Brevundimonas lenta]MBB4083831.1 hypothetical protein [Brevundimonas lenta]